MKESRILVVDDHPELSRTLAVGLKREGFQVLTANDGLEALEAIRTDPPDLILMDVMMPRMDGLEATRRIKADPATRSIPVVLLTAKDQPTDILAGLEAGAEDYVAKPPQFRILLARIRGLLRLKGFVAELAHELNNPLTVLMANAETLADMTRQLIDHVKDAPAEDLPACREQAVAIALDMDSILGDMVDGSNRVRELMIRFDTLSEQV